MDGLTDIATTGAPGVVTALGMGTVFFCLTMLYVTTRVLGWWLSPERRKAAATAANAPTPASSSDEAASGAAPEQATADGADQAALVAAMTLVLARHRASVLRSHDAEPTDRDPWKMAGRMRMLRG